MPSFNKSSFPNLAACTSHFDTGFENLDQLATKSKQMGRAPHKSSNGSAPEIFPRPSRGGGGEGALAELSAMKRFKQVGYRPYGSFPTSTGTSKTDLPVLTNDLIPCVAVVMSGASADGTSRNARLFHVFPGNFKAGDALADYKRYLDARGLSNVSAVLAGGEARPEELMKHGLDAETAEKAARNVKSMVKYLKIKLGAEGVTVAKDYAGERRPPEMTPNSNVGFMLAEREGKIKLNFIMDARFV